MPTFINTSTRGSMHPLAFQGLLPTNCYSQLMELIRPRLGDAYVLLFATPESDTERDTLDWYSPVKGQVRPLTDLGEEEKDKVLTLLAKMGDELRTVAEQMKESGDSQRVLGGNLLLLALCYPDESCIYLVGEQPVITCWGFGFSTAGALPQDISRLAVRTTIPQAPLAPAPVEPVPPLAPAMDVPPVAPVPVLRRSAWPWLLLPILLALLLSALLLVSWCGRPPLVPVPGLKLNGPAIFCIPDPAAEALLAEQKRGTSLLDELKGLREQAALCQDRLNSPKKPEEVKAEPAPKPGKILKPGVVPPLLEPVLNPENPAEPVLEPVLEPDAVLEPKQPGDPLLKPKPEVPAKELELKITDENPTKLPITDLPITKVPVTDIPLNVLEPETKITPEIPLLIGENPELTVVDKPLIDENPLLPVIDKPIVDENPLIPIIDTPIVDENPLIAISDNPLIDKNPLITDRPFVEVPEPRVPEIAEVLDVVDTALTPTTNLTDVPNNVGVLPEGTVATLPNGTTAALPEGTVILPDNTVRLPDGTVARLPAGTVLRRPSSSNSRAVQDFLIRSDPSPAKPAEEPKKPEVQKPEVQKPEPAQPKIKTPEVKTPEIKKPTLKKPEVNKPEVNKPEVNKPTNQGPKIATKKGDPLQLPPNLKANKDLSFLEGNWRSTRPEYNTKRPIVESFAFNANGVGTRTILDINNKKVYNGPARAIVDKNGTLKIVSSEAFASPDKTNPWGSATMSCKNDKNGETECTWVFTDIGNNAVMTQKIDLLMN